MKLAWHKSHDTTESWIGQLCNSSQCCTLPFAYGSNDPFMNGCACGHLCMFYHTPSLCNMKLARFEIHTQMESDEPEAEYT